MVTNTNEALDLLFDHAICNSISRDMMANAEHAIRLIKAQLKRLEPVDAGTHVIVPRALTAENGAKGLLLGEYSIQISHDCPVCDGHGDCEFNEKPCDECNGEGQFVQDHPIDWTTIKQIYAKAIEYFTHDHEAQVQS